MKSWWKGTHQTASPVSGGDTTVPTRWSLVTLGSVLATTATTLSCGPDLSRVLNVTSMEALSPGASGVLGHVLATVQPQVVLTSASTAFPGPWFVNENTCSTTCPSLTTPNSIRVSANARVGRSVSTSTLEAVAGFTIMWVPTASGSPHPAQAHIRAIEVRAPFQDIIR